MDGSRSFWLSQLLFFICSFFPPPNLIFRAANPFSKTELQVNITISSFKRPIVPGNIIGPSTSLNFISYNHFHFLFKFLYLAAKLFFGFFSVPPGFKASHSPLSLFPFCSDDVEMLYSYTSLLLNIREQYCK